MQQLLEHWDALNRENLRVHFIGSLQKNKVKYIADKVCMIHSLDSYKLAEEIEKQSAKRGIVTDVLVEINSGKEESKGGVMPEALVKERGLVQVSDTGAIDAAVQKVLAANPAEVEAYKGGKTKLISFFVGQVMREMRGKANPAVVNEALARFLN